MPEVSYAVILTHDATRAAACLRSLAEQGTMAEILLVLNDVDAELRAVAEHAEGSRIVHDGTDVGVVHGWNLALEAAAADRVCVVHEDSELKPGCARRLLDALSARPDAAAVGPRIHTTDGTPPYYGGILWADAATTRLTEPARLDGPFAVDYASSSCLMLDRPAALGVGGFDERFFPAIYVDAALACALWSAGRTVLCDPAAESVHATGAMVNPEHGAVRSPRFRRFLVDRNRARFAAAWAGLLSEHAARSDAQDARNPPAAEVADALARTAARERAARDAAPPVPDGSLALPADVERHASRLRREVEGEFMEALVEREAWLEAELQRVHREYAALWADRERLRSMGPGENPVEG